MPPAPPIRLQVALPLPLPQTFDYLPPDRHTPGGGWLGCRVRVPFGSGERIGIVVAIVDGVLPEGAVLKPVIERLDPATLLDDELDATLRWASRYYRRPLGDVLAQAIPARLREGGELPEPGAAGWRIDADLADPSALRAGSRPRLLAERLLAAGPLAESELSDFLPSWRDALRRLQARGWVQPFRLPVSATAQPLQPEPEPNTEQQAAIDHLQGIEGFRPVLLDGVTGSGKTEVYLRAIADCVASGRQALVLVPEIGLTPQTLRRFRARLPVRVLASHSGMNDGERLAAWAAMRSGEAQVLIGTRSAAFTPLPKAGLIVIDEEHDASYKQQDGFRYHARDLALMRGKTLGIPVLMGSATPALETLRNAIDGRYDWLRLRRRAGGAGSPTVRVIDLRRQRLVDGLSSPLIEAIGAHLERGQQVLVFRNRRGYAPVLLCHDCGWTARCRRCDAALTVHARGGRLICHHCGARQSSPAACPDCGSLGLQPQGAGTERIEQALAERFPDTALIRVDRETTRGRDALAAHFEQLGDRPGILVGTQMLAKGHDLPRLSLVAVIGIDEGLFSADFRAPERLAQLLIQVAGRAGRADIPGEMLLQTHHPEHPLLTTLLASGYHGFAERALAEREDAGLPPFGHLALLRAEATHQQALQEFLDLAATSAREIASNDIQLHGPMPAPMPRRQGRLRAQLLLSSTSRSSLQALLSSWSHRLYAMPQARKVRWSIDVDPQDLY